VLADAVDECGQRRACDWEPRHVEDSPELGPFHVVEAIRRLLRRRGDEARTSAVVRGAVERYAAYIFAHGDLDATCEG